MKLCAAGLNFFLREKLTQVVHGDGDHGSSSEDDEVSELRNKINRTAHSRKAKKSKRKLKAALSHAMVSKKRQAPPPPPGAAALRLLYNPNAFATQLLAKFRPGHSGVIKWELRVMIFEVVARCMAVHKLVVERFFTMMESYMQPHQTDIVRLMAAAVQGVNELTSPDLLQSLLRVIADRFVNDHSRPEVMAAGLNTIRAISERNPHGMERDLLQDLVQYRKFKDKSVTVAARSLVSTFRALAPDLLARKDRGKIGAQLSSLQYGAASIPTGVPGAELLAASGLAGNRAWDACTCACACVHARRW